MKRIHSVDIVRGLVMIIMALDHTRDCLNVSAPTGDPTDLATTTPGLFATRWITHLCAPVFVFLSGTSAFLSIQKTGALAENRMFLLKRGLWLVILNFTLVNFGIFLDPHFGILLSQVIAVIGYCFMGLALMTGFSRRVIAITGLVMLLGHNLLDGVQVGQGTAFQPVWATLMGVGFFKITPGMSYLIVYPVIPWLGIMLLGYACGDWFLQADEQRRKTFLQTALASLALFMLLRTWNIYGDAAHWAPQKDLTFSVMSFLNLTKYPVSLLYSLATLGIMFLALYAFDKVQNRFTDFVTVYGRVPLFYYLAHWFVIHLVASTVFMAQGFHLADFSVKGMGFGRPATAPNGLDLPGTYLAWLTVVAIMYPLCGWYWRYKSAHKDNAWLRYL